VQPYLHFVQTLAVGQDGTVDFYVEAKVNERAFWLQRFGYEFAVTDPDAAFSYFGKGPGETYCDLSRYAAYGIWKSTASREYVPYIRPQEHGNHTDSRWLRIGKLEFAAEDQFEINVSQYGTDTLTAANHTDELVADGNTHVRIDYKVSGLGSNSCGPSLEKQYRLDEKEISFRFFIRPLRG
jgi:beta-galactosidase